MSWVASSASSREAIVVVQVVLIGGEVVLARVIGEKVEVVLIVVSMRVVVAVDALIREDVVSMVVKGSLLSRLRYRSDESPEKTLTDIVVR